MVEMTKAPVTTETRGRKKSPKGVVRDLTNQDLHNPDIVAAFTINALRRYSTEMVRPGNGLDCGIYTKEKMAEVAKYVSALLADVKV